MFHEYCKSRPLLSRKTIKTEERVVFDDKSIDLMKTIDPRIFAGLFLDSQRPQHETGVGTRAWRHTASSNQLFIFCFRKHLFVLPSFGLDFSAKKGEKCYFYWPDREEITFSNEMWGKERNPSVKFLLASTFLMASEIPAGFENFLKPTLKPRGMRQKLKSSGMQPEVARVYFSFTSLSTVSRVI